MYRAAPGPSASSGGGVDSSGGDNGSPASTAFRAAEKQYQLHYEQVVRYKNGKAKGSRLEVRPTDLSRVLDLASGLSGSEPPGVEAHWSGALGTAAYCFAGRPGLWVIPGAVAPALQRRIIVDCLTRFPLGPNRTNHTPQHGLLPGEPCGLWEAAQRGLFLQRRPAPAAAPDGSSQQQQKQQKQQQIEEQGVATSAGTAGCRADGAGAASDSPASGATPEASSAAVMGAWESGDGGQSGQEGTVAAKLLRKLRWATLGPPYDWTQRVYRSDLPHSPLPRYLAELAVRLAAAVGELGAAGAGGGAASAGAQPFRPDVALVNYYHQGDTLGGHKDDAERDLGQPIVTLSLGCEAVFLAGGLTRDVPPLALLLRSGDAVVMAGEARRCYHGLPRVLTDRPLPPELLEAGSTEDGTAGAAAGAAAAAGAVGPTAWEEQERGITSGDLAPFAEHMRGCRINVSIREAA